MILSGDQSIHYYIVASTSVVKSALEEHRDNLYDSFHEFVDSFHYEYDAIAKNQSNRDANIQAAQIEQNKRKTFLGRFALRNFQKDYEDVALPANCSAMTFSQMVTELKKMLETH